MICCCIGKNDIGDLLSGKAGSPQMAEIRLDLLSLDEKRVANIFATAPIPLIATDRNCKDGGKMLAVAVEAGAQWADVEIEAPEEVVKTVSGACRKNGAKLIRSCHCEGPVKSLDSLREKVDDCRLGGADIVKIALEPKSDEDVRLLMSLYEYYSPGTLVAFAIGDTYKNTRLECLKLGAPFTYASSGDGESVAPGQIPYADMQSAVFGKLKDIRPEDALVPPCSKSIAQRAILLAALAKGRSRISGYTPCADSDAALSVAISLGARVFRESEEDDTVTLHVEGIGAVPGCLGNISLKVGESAFLARTLQAIGSCICTGGCKIETAGTLSGRNLAAPRPFNAIQRDGVIKLAPGLRAGKVVLDGKDTSQLASGTMMALALCRGESSLFINNPSSLPYLFLTAEMLSAAGCKVKGRASRCGRELKDTWEGCDSVVFRIKSSGLQAADFDIERDWGVAAVFLAAGAIFGSATVCGLAPDSLQADIAILDLLVDAGAFLSVDEEGQGAVITSAKAPLNAFEMDFSNSPDLFPVAAVLAAFCQGTSRLKGVSRLRGKESDRVAAMQRILGDMGVNVSFDGETFSVKGESLASRSLNGRLLKGGVYPSFSDHRIVMALCLASLGSDGEITADSYEPLSKSCPDFKQMWNEYVRQ